MEKKSTVELHEELSAREGVTEIVVGPYETFKIVQDQRTHEFTGPATLKIENQLSVRIDVKNIKFADSFEQLKLERKLTENSNLAIRELEELIKRSILYVSFK